jgi:hypothetical protein
MAQSDEFERLPVEHFKLTAQLSARNRAGCPKTNLS